ncbi:MAG: ECF transporter S component [Bacilli bacterium]|jgi:riboflavin transporter FmnP|nr:ECF transporter S component [Bacilli bacterium]NLN80421.1 ECF transporter S component [Erysipelotrichia bacterium]
MYSIFIGFLIVWLFCFYLVARTCKPRKIKKINLVRLLSRVSIFGALSAILYITPFLKFPLPIFPQFLEIHFDEVPLFIAGFAYGPLAAILATVVKTIIKLPFTSTLTVGEWADLIYSIAFIVPASLIYQKRRNLKGVFYGLGLGFIVQIIVSLFFNIYLMVPFYMFVMGFPKEALLAMAQLANPKITNVEWSLGLYAIVPFNVIKNSIIIAITLLVYKSSHNLMIRFEEKNYPTCQG